MQPRVPEISNEFFTPERLAFLEEHGYLVIPDVVPVEECNKMLANIREFFQTWNGNLTEGSDPSLWKNSRLPPGTIHGIVRAAAHLQAQWDARQHPRVYQCYKEYWGEEDLRVSFDGFCYYRAGSYERGKLTAWRHTDQGPPTKKPIVFVDGSSTHVPLEGRCLQGYLCLIDSTAESDGALVVNDKGHRTHHTFFSRYPKYADVGKGDSNWVRFTPEELAKYGADPEFLTKIEKDGREYLSESDPDKHSPHPVPMPSVRVGAPAGAMVFWYSRTPHDNTPPLPTGRDRAVIYVCMAPAKWLTKSDIKRRKQAWEERRQISHWPCGGQTKFLSPRFYPSDYPERKSRYDTLVRLPLLAAPSLTPLGERLCGIEDHLLLAEPSVDRAKRAAERACPQHTVAKRCRSVSTEEIIVVD